jgi:hypothetical protein
MTIRLRDRAIPKILSAFWTDVMRLNENNDSFVVFPAKHPEVGDLVIHDDRVMNSRCTWVGSRTLTSAITKKTLAPRRRQSVSQRMLWSSCGKSSQMKSNSMERLARVAGVNAARKNVAWCRRFLPARRHTSGQDQLPENDA